MSVRFSVLVPVYNVEKYLAECINSVLNQTYQNFELILVDDGSTDTSGQICDEYAARDTRIRVFHQVNQGHTMARRKGISAAVGEYVLFLDSDDYWDADLLDTINTTIEEFVCDMVIFKFRCVTEIGEQMLDFKAQFHDRTNFTRHNRKPLFQAINNGNSELYSLCVKAVKRQIIDNLDSLKYQHIKHNEDLLQSLPYIYNSKSIVYLDHTMYNYRHNPQSITHSFNLNMLSDILEVRKVLLEYLFLEGLSKKDILKDFYNTNIRNAVAYMYYLMNASLPYAKKRETLCQIHTMPLYRDALIYFDPSIYSLSEKIRFALFQKHYYMLLFVLCKSISIKVKLYFLLTRKTKA